jgi:hypothetical protein
MDNPGIFFVRIRIVAEELKSEPLCFGVKDGEVVSRHVLIVHDGSPALDGVARIGWAGRLLADGGGRADSAGGTLRELSGHEKMIPV